jgi:nitrite reductase/ring-hydroxylating ferredoxin subunit
VSNFESVGRVADFPDRTLRMFVINKEEVVVVRVDDRFYAFGNDCTHVGAPLVEGYLEDDCRITCAYHRWSFDMATGKEELGGAAIPVFEVRVENDEVLVERIEHDDSWRPPHLRFVSLKD